MRDGQLSTASRLWADPPTVGFAMEGGEPLQKVCTNVVLPVLSPPTTSTFTVPA